MVNGANEWTAWFGSQSPVGETVLTFFLGASSTPPSLPPGGSYTAPAPELFDGDGNPLAPISGFPVTILPS